MGLVATSFYTLSKHISIFRRFHLSYKAQKEKRPLLSQDRFLAKIAIVFSARRIPAVFLINSAPWSMRRQNASMLAGDASMDSWFREIHVPRAWRLKKGEGNYFSRNFTYVLRTTTASHMVSFIDFYFHFLANFLTLTSPHIFSLFTL